MCTLAKNVWLKTSARTTYESSALQGQEHISAVCPCVDAWLKVKDSLFHTVSTGCGCARRDEPRAEREERVQILHYQYGRIGIDHNRQKPWVFSPSLCLGKKVRLLNTGLV